VSDTSPRQVGPAGDLYTSFKVTLFGKVFVFSYPLGNYIFVKVIVFFLYLLKKTNLELLCFAGFIGTLILLILFCCDII